MSDERQSARYTLTVYERPKALQYPGQFWQADSGIYHAVGATPGAAVERLILHIERSGPKTANAP